MICFLTSFPLAEIMYFISITLYLPILGSSNAAANKDMMSKVLLNRDTIFYRVENIVGNEEIAHYKQFLLFPQRFQKLSFVDAFR